MTWHHQCRPPGDCSIWLHRKTSGAGWECRGCGQLWLLARRVWETPCGGYQYMPSPQIEFRRNDA